MKAAVLFVAVLAGCATAAKFETRMNALMYKSESEVVAALGPPQSVYAAPNGDRVLTYARNGQMTMPGATTMQPVTSTTRGNMTVNSGMKQSTGTYTQQTTSYVPMTAPSTTIALSCTLNFNIRSGVVTSWNSNGNRCVSE